MSCASSQSCCPKDSSKCCSGKKDCDITKEDVKDYYGKRLKTNKDLQTSACTVAQSGRVPKHVRDALALVHDEVASKYEFLGYNYV